MKILKIVSIVILSLIIVLTPVILPAVLIFRLPDQYAHTFHGELDEKFDRLNSIDEPKIVVVGGSSVAFGLDSKKLEEYTGMPTVNFGLYAALGTKLMLDLSLSGIGEGDIVVVSPEMDPETLSLYFSSGATLMAIDGDHSIIKHIKRSDKLKMLGAAWDFLLDKWSLYKGEKSDIF